MLLLNAITATNATKIELELTGRNFRGASIPELKATTMVAGESISVFEDVNGVWELRTTLDDSTRTATINSIGTYAISVVVVDTDTGTITTVDPTGITLIDVGATDWLATVNVGDTVRNTTDGSIATVVTVDSNTQITHTALTGGTDDEWQTSDGYSITSPISLVLDASGALPGYAL